MCARLGLGYLNSAKEALGCPSMKGLKLAPANQS